MRHLAVLGSTGSIGTATLDVVAHHPERLEVVALAAGRNLELMLEQCRRFRPRCISLNRREDAEALRAQLDYAPEVHWGPEGLLACALHAGVDTVVAAVVGSVGLASTEAALRAGHRVCVANKESLVVGGALMRRALEQGGGELLPVDSEHAALHQLLDGRDPCNIREVRLTASGGPFRDWSMERIQRATVEQALNHPTWKMGPKITVDSATLMNKGLEVIEAAVLFGLEPEQIGVTVHPQSQVHAMVGFTDGTYQLQVSANDMRMPIQYALFHPDCLPGPVSAYDWDLTRTWTFDTPDLERFPCLALAYEALRHGGSAPAALNAANEESVAAFLEGRIGFWGIQACNTEVLMRMPQGDVTSLEAVLATDREARRMARIFLERQ